MKEFEAVIKRKISRLRKGEPPRLMDLFAGCGGLTLGFVTAGFEPVASVEIDPFAAQSHGTNFGKFHKHGSTASHCQARDIVRDQPGDVFSALNLKGHVDDQIDVLVGGPPCQAFARVGRAKLRDEARRRNDDDADIAHVTDDRANLYQRYLTYVLETKPVALLMENVPDMLNHGGRNLAEIVRDHLHTLGYETRYALLNAAFFGVPQTRERLFLIAFHKLLGAEPVFPVPTHWCDLPRGYEGTRATARKLIIGLDAGGGTSGHRWIDDPPHQTILQSTTAEEALADLPPINAIKLLASGGILRGRKDPSAIVEYEGEPSTKWSKLMRNWPNFSTKDSTTGHIIRYLPRDYKFFKIMKPGWQYPDMWRCVEATRELKLKRLQTSNYSASIRAKKASQIREEWNLPYDPEKFPNKWWKLDGERPARTLMAHLSKDSYSHIHFDSEQARTISVREAARLQSFPDGFKLSGSMNPAFRQIGNAVPPLMAYALAMGIRHGMGLRALPDLRVEFLGVSSSLIQYSTGRG